MSTSAAASCSPATAPMLEPGSDLQKQAIEKARQMFDQLPGGSKLFQQCIQQDDALSGLVQKIKERYARQKGKKSAKLLSQFENLTTWLQNFSSVVDVAVQAQVSIALPIWVPLKFALQVSNFHATIADQIVTMVQEISDALPRFEIYEKLNSDPRLQLALLNIFTDIVEFCVKTFAYFSRGSFVRIGKIIVSPIKKELSGIIARAKGHAEDADRTALAVELSKISDFREESRARQFEDSKISCQAWLNASNIRQAYQLLCEERLSDTCNWIWTQRPLLEWSTSQGSSPADRLLCVSGKNGCGKSVLAAAINEGLMQQGKHAMFFAFSGTEDSRQSVDSLCRSFLSQLLEGPVQDKGLQALRALMLRGQPLASELWDVLSQVASLFQESTYWIIDGADECQDPNDTLFERLTTFLDNNRSARMIVLGRPHAFGPVSPAKYTMEINPSLIQSDIDTYIRFEIGKSTYLQSPAIRHLVFETLQSGSHGMFLWVKYMIKDLNRPSSKTDLKHRLHNLPCGLQETYRHILSRRIQTLDNIDLRFIRCVLALIIAARRPLKLEELQYAQAIAAWSASKSSDTCSFQEYTIKDLDQKIIRTCGDLIQLTESTISLVHLSAKEFLTRPEMLWSHDDDRKIASLRIDPQESHYLFCSACLDYLTIGEYGFPLISSDSLTASRDHGLLEYASKNVVYHFNRAGIFSANVFDKVLHFSKSEACLSWAENFSVHLLEDGSSGWDTEEFRTFISWLNREGQREKISHRFQTLLGHQLENRRRKFGEQDWRTNQLTMIMDIVEDGGYAESMDSTTAYQPEASDAAIQRASNEAFTNISELMEVLKHNGPLPIPKQVDLLLRLQFHLRRIKVLMDPLKLLFDIILRNTAVLPVYALLIIGDFCSRLKKHDMALDMYHAALAKLRTHGVPLEYEICNDIGYIKSCLSRYQEAEEWYRRAMEGRKKVLGVDHEDTLWSSRGLSFALWDQGKCADAEDMHRLVMEGRLRILGEEHEDTLSSILVLGAMLQLQGKFSSAEEMYRRVMELSEKTLGAKHEDTLHIIDCLGETLDSQGKYTEVEELYRRINRYHTEDARAGA